MIPYFSCRSFLVNSALLSYFQLDPAQFPAHHQRVEPFELIFKFNAASRAAFNSAMR
jgi:hypothetical protein